MERISQDTFNVRLTRENIEVIGVALAARMEFMQQEIEMIDEFDLSLDKDYPQHQIELCSAAKSAVYDAFYTGECNETAG